VTVLTFIAVRAAIQAKNGCQIAENLAAGEGATRPRKDAAEYGTEDDSDDGTAEEPARRAAPAGEPVRKRRKAPSADGSP
jgi:hypothetical protein